MSEVPHRLIQFSVEHDALVLLDNRREVLHYIHVYSIASRLIRIVLHCEWTDTESP